MDFITGTIVAFSIINNLVKLTFVDDTTQQRVTETFKRGKYSRGDFQKNSKFNLEYEWGDDGARKILSFRLG